MSAALIWAGVVVAAFAAIRLSLTRDRDLRPHVVSLGSVLAPPLVIIGLAPVPWSSWHDIAKLAWLVAGVTVFGLLLLT